MDFLKLVTWYQETGSLLMVDLLNAEIVSLIRGNSRWYFDEIQVMQTMQIRYVHVVEWRFTPRPELINSRSNRPFHYR
jgi:hypothetical protein